jgi:serine/threonine-protein kinase ULK2
MEGVKDYEIYTDSLLGSGSFSNVYLGKYVGSGTKYVGRNKTVAVKVIETARLTESALKIVEDEIEIMELIKDNPHPNIVTCYETICTKDKIFIIMEYCDSGNLKSIIKKPIREKWIQFYFSQLANGLRYLDHHNIIHRDLKPKNILLTNRRKFLKIADFGFARRSNQESLYDTMCGSPLYMAPEIMKNNYYNKKVDLWSIGWILFEMLYGYHPGSTCKKFDQWKEKLHTMDIQIPPANCRNKDVSDDCLNLLRKLLQVESKNRMTWDEFFDYPWINLYATEVKKTDSYEEQIKNMSIGSLTPKNEYLKMDDKYDDVQSRLEIIHDYYDRVTTSPTGSSRDLRADTDFVFEMEIDEPKKKKNTLSISPANGDIIIPKKIIK